MAKVYSVNEICKLTKVSVRTLHYYDEIKLLRPAHRTGSGRRLYLEEDLLRLQQIVTLKYMNFSLTQIKKLINGDHFDIFSAIKMQSKALADEAERIKKASNLLGYLLENHEAAKPVDWKVVGNVIDVLRMSEKDKNAWYEKYLNKMEMQIFNKVKKTRTDKWHDLFLEIKKNIDIDPESKAGIRLMNKWLALAKEAYGDHPELIKKLWEGYKAGVIPQSFFPHDKQVITFLSKAFDKINK